MKREIIPACMPERFDDIEISAAPMRNLAKTIQLDLMDGKYVPETTWPFFYEDDYNLRDIKNEDLGLPYWEELNYELDLMVSRPEERLDDWFSLGATRIIFHYASVYDWEKIKNISFDKRDFTKIGLAVTIHDVYTDYKSLISDGVVDFVQVMGIEHIGYMGEPFDEHCLDIIEQLKLDFPELVISVDGGVSLYTLNDLVNAGAERFVSGSAIYKQGMARDNYQDLYDEVNPY